MTDGQRESVEISVRNIPIVMLTDRKAGLSESEKKLAEIIRHKL
jgi:hypothetical protein